jgi:hypothetical protein
MNQRVDRSMKKALMMMMIYTMVEFDDGDDNGN